MAHCARCSYDLAGAPGNAETLTCPECGLTGPPVDVVAELRPIDRDRREVIIAFVPTSACMLVAVLMAVINGVLPLLKLNALTDVCGIILGLAMILGVMLGVAMPLTASLRALGGPERVASRAYHAFCVFLSGVVLNLLQVVMVGVPLWSVLDD